MKPEPREIMALGMLKSFQERIAASAGMPYEQTKITTPNIGIYQDYAAAAETALRDAGYAIVLDEAQLLEKGAEVKLKP